MMRFESFRSSFLVSSFQIAFASLFMGLSHGTAGAAADLVPVSISAAQTAALNVTITDTVKNAGDVASNPFEISYYRGTAVYVRGWWGNNYNSYWSMPTSGGTLLCKRPVSELAAGASSGPTATTCPHNLPVPSVGTTYYVYAVVDSGAMVAESNESNNALASAMFAVTVGPDLTPTVISAVQTAPGDITITDTVKNTGNVDAGAFEISYYLRTAVWVQGWWGNNYNSYWDRPTSGGTFVCKRTVAGLTAGASSGPATITCPHGLPAPTVSDTYYVYAVVDSSATVAETAEGNNALSSAMFRIALGPDLVPTAISAAAVGVTDVTVTDTVRNAGNTDAGTFEVSYYLAKPVWVTYYGESSTWKVQTTPTSGGTFICKRAVAGVAAEASDGPVTTTCAHNLPAPTVDTYYVYSVVDSGGTVGETNEGNNALASSTFGVVIGADLTPTAISAVPAGLTDITITDTVRNAGNADAGGFEISYYLAQPVGVTQFYENGSYSYQTTPASGGTFICKRLVAGLVVGANDGPVTTTCAHNVPVPTNGTYYVYAVVDSGGGVGETNEGNNALSSGMFNVVIGPDLTPAVLSVTGSGLLTISDQVANQGNVDAAAFDIGFYLSTDAVYQAGTDAPLVDPAGNPCRRAVAGLAAGASDPATDTGTSTCLVGGGATPGYYYVIAVADSGAAVAETNEANNTKASNLVKIGPGTVIESCNPNSGSIGDVIKLFGTGFGAAQGNSIVVFNGVTATEILLWSETEIHVKVPEGATTGQVRVIGSGGSTFCNFTVVPLPPPVPPVDYDITAVHVKGEVDENESFDLELSVINVNAPSDPGFSYEIVGRSRGIEFFRTSGAGYDPYDGVATTLVIPVIAPSDLHDDDCLEFTVTVTDEDPDVDEVKAVIGEDDDHDEARTCKAKNKFKFRSPDNAESVQIGAVVEVTFRLEDKITGLPITDANAFLWVAKVTDHEIPDAPATPDPSAVPDVGNRFRFDPGDPGSSADDVYVFNWNTTGLTPGTWRLRVDLGDGKPHHLIIKLYP